MGYRNFDWRCIECDCEHEGLVWVPHGERPPAETPIECPACEKVQTHARLVSLPAQYLYDRPYAPIVHGGKFDTAGDRKPPPLPELPADASFDKARDFFASKGYKEAAKARFAVAQENAQKKARLKAMQKDPNITLRTNPLPGDPKNT